VTNDFPIFFQSAWKASIIPLGQDTAFFAMKAFGNYDMTFPLVLAVVGATIGQMFNWYIGKWLIAHRAQMKINDYWLNRVSSLFNKYGIFLLLFSWAPLCNFFVVLAGFVGTKPKIVLPLIIIGQAAYYGLGL
jgi:membrane protein YqaA with SNARE-associated domain